MRNRSRPDQSSPKRTDNRGMSNYPTSSFTTQAGGHHVVVPPNVFSGMPFMAEVNGEKFLVTCPPNTHPGQRIQVNLDSGAGHSRTAPRLRSPVPHRSHADLFDVVIPYGVYPGGKFKTRAHKKGICRGVPTQHKTGPKDPCSGLRWRDNREHPGLPEKPQWSALRLTRSKLVRI